MIEAMKRNLGMIVLCSTVVFVFGLAYLDSRQHGRSADDRARLSATTDRIDAVARDTAARVAALEAQFRAMTEPPKPKTLNAEDAPE